MARFIFHPEEMTPEERLEWFVDVMGKALLKCALEDRRNREHPPVQTAPLSTENPPENDLLNGPHRATVSETEGGQDAPSKQG